MLSKNAYRLRRGQSPVSSNKDIVGKYFHKASNGRKTFVWNRPVNMSMDQKTIHLLMEARRYNEIPLKKEGSGFK